MRGSHLTELPTVLAALQLDWVQAIEIESFGDRISGCTEPRVSSPSSSYTSTLCPPPPPLPPLSPVTPRHSPHAGNIIAVVPAYVATQPDATRLAVGAVGEVLDAGSDGLAAGRGNAAGAAGPRSDYTANGVARVRRR